MDTWSGPQLRLCSTARNRRCFSQWSQASAEPHRLVERARVNSAGPCRLSTREIARRLQTRPARVSKWRKRFARERLAGLSDAQRKGKPKSYDQVTEKRILSLLDTDPPSGYSQWNGRLLAQSLADVSDDQVWRVLRKHKIQLQRRRSWCIPTDPEFARKSRRHCGALSASSRTCRGGLRQ